MSEIFNWLRRAETGRSENPPRLIPKSNEPDLFPNGIEHYEKPKQLAILPRSNPAREIFVDASSMEISNWNPLISRVLEPLSIEGEQYRLLRAKLSSAGKDHVFQKILISSAVAGEGKTSTCCSLAGILAQEPGKRVLLIDADLRKPHVAQNYGLMNPDDLVGLCQVLRGEVSPMDALIKASGMELFLLPSGGRPQNPSELLSSTNMGSALKNFAEVFDWILIDSPPILALADSMLLAQLCDTVLLVIRSGHTPAKLVKEAIQRIGAEKICGVAINRVKKTTQSQYYIYDYVREQKR